MAFDQPTRGRLQKLVNSCRGLLSDEFSIQLQQTYGLDPKTGEVTLMARLTHLDDRQRHTAEVLRQTLAHYLGADADDTDHRIAVLDRMVREQAFTVLNRMAALLMMEARGQLIESVSKGYQSRGYQLYSKIAGTALGETGQAFQVYLFSVFDELAQELPALFDRYAANGLLFPRETALRALLDELNHFDIEPLWAADETIGWIYQYFNSKEERKAMRDASQVPRNSRELAVRNQFFTPRYVVEFLVDNTLGRLWFNATGGQTDLRNRCQYLLVKPDEHPQVAIKLRDPRTLKLLDPACGSMHFGLYAFDLFVEIYREAWAWEQQHGPGSLDVSTQPQAPLMPLCKTYEDEAAFVRDVPRLIIEKNIYGVDIDPRAAQIATLALWLRAQRAWHDAAIKVKDRPLIGQGHVIAAVAPPAERELRLKFATNLDQRDAELFEKTLQLLKSLPELGVLLQVERELPNMIRQVYGGKGTGLFAQQEQENWKQAEVRLREALTEFAQAANSTYQGHLFAQDALQGLRLIDLCREEFDVVVMNPPFGQISREKFEYLKTNYPDSYIDIYTCFVSRAVQLCKGRVGAISSRSFLITKRLERFRENCALPRIDLVLDLGWPVMDDATVQSAAFTLDCSASEPSHSIVAIDRRSYAQKDQNLKLNHGIQNIQDCFSVLREKIRKLSRFRILYNLPDFAFDLFIDRKAIGENILIAKTGMKSFHDVRFLRARHEISPISIGKGQKWVPLAKGGPYAAFYSDLPLVVNWENDGREICENAIAIHGQIWQARQASVHYYKSGGTYSRRSKDFAVRVLPADFIIGEKGPAILPVGSYDPLFVVGLMNARLFRAIVNFQANAKQFDTGLVEACPYSDFSSDEQLVIKTATINAVNGLREIAQGYEEDSHFISPQIAATFDLTFRAYASHDEEKYELVESSRIIIDEVVDSNYGVDSIRLGKVLLSDSSNIDEDEDESESEDEENESHAFSPKEIGFRLLSYAFGAAIGRWDIRQAVLTEARQNTESCLAPIPQYIPGLLRPVVNQCESNNYPLKIPVSGLLVDDESAEFDVIARTRAAVQVWLGSCADDFENQIAASLKINSIRDYFRSTSGFFSDHIALYTRSKRKAPIYWPLSTGSGSFTLWVYYPSLNNQTLFTAVNDFLDGPNGKLTQISRECAELRMKGNGRSPVEEKQYETLQTFEQELTDLRDTLLKIAPTYQPNYDDGVQITAAPLWPLFRHKPWQKVLKDTWAKLEKGDHDWAHLAMAYWPERVREKCRTDKSLAIAHGLEALYVEMEATPKKTRGKKKAGTNE